MSLHGKIGAWFVFFASLTVILIVLGDYYQSTHALRMVLEVRAKGIASQTAAEVERRYERAEAELLAISYAALAGPRRVQAPPRYASISVLRGGRAVWQHGETPNELRPDGCSTGLVRFDFAVPGGIDDNVRVQATMRAANFFELMSTVTARLGRGGITSVMRARDGSLVFDYGCTIRSAAVSERLEARVAELVTQSETEPGQVSLAALSGGRGEHERVVAITRTATPQWVVVVGVDYDEFAAPFGRARAKYLATVVSVLLVAMALVLRAIRHDMRRLTAIARAADAIGHGHFDVWLPPPTGDDVGRLSLSLGRMTDRLSSTIRQMEITKAMAAVGELATYLSHEIRNPLSSIRLNLQMLRRDLHAGAVPDDGPQLVELCLTELQRLDDVVKTVLEVGRTNGPSAAGVCNAHDVIRETVQVMQSKLTGHGIEVELGLRSPMEDVAIDAKQLRSVLVNLLLNGIDALHGSSEKRIRITSELEDIGDGAPQLGLHIADSGPGVPAHLRERIFEPFFTTKQSGNGIGLATALRTVQECGGVLRLHAGEWPSGAEFVLELPIVQQQRKARRRDLVAAS